MTVASASWRAPGWTNDEYDAAGVSKSAARRFRRIWLPPDVAGLMRNRKFTYDQIERLGASTPLRVLIKAVDTEWVRPDNLPAFQYMANRGPHTLKAYVDAGLDAADCWALLHTFRVHPTAVRAYAVAFAPPAGWLPGQLGVAVNAHGVPASDLPAWLEFAAHSRATTPPPFEAPEGGPWEFVGGRSWLYFAAGMSISEAFKEEHVMRRHPRSSTSMNRVDALVTLGRMRGHQVADAGFWLRSRS